MDAAIAAVGGVVSERGEMPERTIELGLTMHVGCVVAGMGIALLQGACWRPSPRARGLSPSPPPRENGTTRANLAQGRELAEFQALQTGVR